MEYVVVNHADRELTRLMLWIPFALLADRLYSRCIDQVHWIAAGCDAASGRFRSFRVPAGIGEVPNDVEAQLLSSKSSSPFAVDGTRGILGGGHYCHPCRSIRPAGPHLPGKPESSQLRAGIGTVS